MNIHEYQAKQILREYGIPMPNFIVIADLEELPEALKSLGLSQAVIKVQVHAGGRGKAGGVKLAKKPGEIEQYVKELLGMKIVNNQTGKAGVVAGKVMISELLDYRKEYYLGAVIDRQKGKAMIIASPEGGTEIEEVAAKSPGKIRTFPITNAGTLRSYELLLLAKFMGWSGRTAEQGKQIVSALAQAFVHTDASLIEINPLVETADGSLAALDAKIVIDDNALYRQKKIAEFYDPSQLPANEAQAKRFDLAYVALDGEIGCMVNGAGLAMATMDIIHHYGGTPANFLDVGGGASQEKVSEGFKIILADSRVKAILVNIFGGIMNCDTLAAGILAAASDNGIPVPLVVRMEGTNVELGKKRLKESGMNFIIADSLGDAAQKAVQAALQ